MDNIDNSKNEKEVAEVKEEASSYDFVREKIKERPINKKRLTRKMILTASMAVLFGSIACLSFLLLTPVFEKLIDSGSKDESIPTHITLREAVNEQDQVEIKAVVNDKPFDEGQDNNIQVEETPIENLNYNDSVSEDSVSSNVTINNVTVQLELDDYHMLYRKMYSLSNEVSKSTVVVTGIKKGQDIFNDEYTNLNRTTGLIIAEDNGRLFILADGSDIPEDNITVTFCDGYVADAVKVSSDKETGLVVYQVYISSLPVTTKESYVVATLGSSRSSVLLGSPVIVLGDPFNTGVSVGYGAITSIDSKMYGADAAYQLINTDLYASSKAKGIVVNVRGQVIGIVCHRKNAEMENLIMAYGISDIKNLIEDLTNNSKRAYIGLCIKDISDEVRKINNIPNGIYVDKVEIDSPAMEVGIGSGDIICSLNGRDITMISDYMNILRGLEDGQSVVIGVMRRNGDEYLKTDITVKVGYKEGDK